MNDFFTIALEGNSPIIATAIHNGHDLSRNIAGIMALDESIRFREEDPFTGIWTNMAENKIIARHSRFEFDLNRPPEKAVYLEPSDSWELQVWKEPPAADVLANTRRTYHHTYERIKTGLSRLVEDFQALVIYDLHSYNYRRGGPDAPPEDPQLNPEINIGTGTMDRTQWAPLLDRIIGDLRGFDFFGRHLDVRENIKFKGGYFPRWVHENFKGSVCCISVEVKKFFMDEWTGRPDWIVTRKIGEALKSTIPGALQELSTHKQKLPAPCKSDE
jgi:N-formylglutamate amidohydrolase